MSKINQFNTPLTEEQKDGVVLNHTLVAIQQLKISKTVDDRTLHPLLDKAMTELSLVNAAMHDIAMTMFIRNLAFAFSVQREYNYWKESGIKAPVSGGQMRNVGLSIERWMNTNKIMTKWLTKRNEDGYLMNMNLIVEHFGYEFFLKNQVTTGAAPSYGAKKIKASKANPSRTIKIEKQSTPRELVCDLLTQNIRKNTSLSLIARHLPKITSSTCNYTTLVVGKDIVGTKFNSTGKTWCKLNGIEQELNSTFDIKVGDIIRYPRKRGNDSMERIARDMVIVEGVKTRMGWSNSQYEEFRHIHIQNTPEHKFSSNTITAFDEESFIKWLGKLSGGQQRVVSTHLCYADANKNLVANPKGKWYDTSLPQWYLKFMRKEEKVAQQARDLMAVGDIEGAKNIVMRGGSKIKTAGVQSIDLFKDLMQRKKSTQEIDTAYTVLTTKMEMLVKSYCCIDGSGSMDSSVDIDGTHIPMIDIAIVLALTFMLTNPSLELGDSCMWYGSEASFTGVTKYKRDITGNRFVSTPLSTTEARKVIDRTKGFKWNFDSLKSANPGHVSNTNPGQVVETFMNIVSRSEMKVEDLPQVLVFITDDCGNTGMSPQQFMARAATIGWSPLFVFWGIQDTRSLDQYKNAPNVLVERGFSENSLTNILRFISKGSINVYDSLWSVYENPAYQAFYI